VVGVADDQQPTVAVREFLAMPREFRRRNRMRRDVAQRQQPVDRGPT
jgi:hypothetical protein